MNFWGKNTTISPAMERFLEAGMVGLFLLFFTVLGGYLLASAKKLPIHHSLESKTVVIQTQLTPMNASVQVTNYRPALAGPIDFQLPKLFDDPNLHDLLNMLSLQLLGMKRQKISASYGNNRAGPDHRSILFYFGQITALPIVDHLLSYSRRPLSSQNSPNIQIKHSHNLSCYFVPCVGGSV